mmetsp:Transcript_25392/g.101195  ORF Transcript_25392/g.101195 Transcript_25392/m.101195 type:complete len:155 (+) Transcript_25392:260-724(+)
MPAVGDEATSQLYLVSLYFALEWPNQTFPLCHETLRATYKRRRYGRVRRRSQLHRDVSSTLDRLGWMYVDSHVTAEGLLLDMARPDTKVAFEADGPSHFVRDLSSGQYVENGATRFKSRLLRRLGWDVVTVPFFEWDRLAGASDKDAYLSARAT